MHKQHGKCSYTLDSSLILHESIIWLREYRQRCMVQVCDLGRSFLKNSDPLYSSLNMYENTCVKTVYIMMPSPCHSAIAPPPFPVHESICTGCNCNAALVCLFFDLYDTDHNGEISLPEAEFMIQDIFGLEWESNTEARAASNWLHGREDVQIGCPELGIDEWADFMSANLSTVAEVVRMRLVLQKKVLETHPG